MADKVTLYNVPTPNGQPITVFLEELGAPYETVKMSISDADIGKVHNQVKSPWFLEINPNGRIPAITYKGFNVFETSAILLYLAEEFDTERKFSIDPKDKEAYSVQLQWLFFAHGGVGPMQGQANHFVKYAPEKIPYAQTRYLNETRRLYGVLNTRLSKVDWLAGDKYTVADVKTAPWVKASAGLGIDLATEFPKVNDWLNRFLARPASQKVFNA